MDSLSESELQKLKKNGFSLAADGSLALDGISLRILFDESLDTKVLKDATAGLDGAVSASAELFSSIIGEDVTIGRSKVKQVKAGSCDFQGISLVIEKGSELARVLGTMDVQQLFIICLTGVALYALYRSFNYAEKRDANKLLQNQKTPSQEVHINDSIVLVQTDLNNRFPNSEQLVNMVVDKLTTIQTEKPSLLRRFATGLTKMAHPGGVEAKGIVTGTENPAMNRKEEVSVLDEEQMKSIPKKMPPKEAEEPEQEFCHNVQIEVIKIDKESTADNALQCRIVDEGYSQKKCPLIIHDANQRQEVMDRFPKNMNVNLFALKRRNSNGEMELKGYVLKDILH